MKASCYLIILILILMTLSCGDDDQSSLSNAQGETIICIEPNNASVILAPDLYHNLHYIPLEINQNSLVDGRHKTKLFDDYIGVFNFGHVPKHLESNNLFDIIYRGHNLNEVLYHQVLTDTIYRVNSEKVISYYLVNHYPPLIIDKADLKVNFNKQNGLFQKYMSDPETTYPIRNILDSENYLVLFFAYGEGRFITVYSKVGNKSRTFRFDGDDMRNHLFHPTMKSTSLDNTMLIELNVEYLRGIADELPLDYLEETKMDVLLDNDAIDENSNPVILTYQLNEAYLDSVFELRF